jgi:hypothetical protein
MGIEIFKKHLREKRAIKISAGFENYNLDSVAKICRAAQRAKASAVGISSNKEVYEIARKNTKLPLFVSSIHPFEILEAVKYGVDGIQIGHYYNTYKAGKRFTSVLPGPSILITLVFLSPKTYIGTSELFMLMVAVGAVISVYVPAASKLNRDNTFLPVAPVSLSVNVSSNASLSFG